MDGDDHIVIARIAALACVVLGTTGASAWADEGSLDPGFNGAQPLVVSEGAPGSATGLTAVAEDANGNVDVTGSTGTGTWYVTRFLPTGQPDPAFGSQGVVTLDLGGGPTGIAVQPDGKVVVGGLAGTGSSTSAELVRFNADGSLDKPFGGTGEVGLSVTGKTVTDAHRVTIDAGGNVYLTGDVFDTGSSTQQGFIAAVDPSGEPASWGSGGLLFPSTGGGIDPSIAAAVPTGDGRLIYGGESIDKSFASHAFIGAVNAASGAADPSFGTGGLFALPIPGTSITDLLLGVDGKVKASGFAPSGSSTGAMFASFLETGTDPRDTTFGGGGQVVIGGAADQPNDGNALTELGGTLFAGATNVTSAGGTQQSIVAVDEKTGAPASGWGAGGFITFPVGAKSFSTSIASGAGKLVLGGQTQQPSGAPDQGSAQVVDTQGSGNGSTEGGSTSGGGTTGGGGATGGGGTQAPNNPCSIQPTPPVSPPIQRPCADIEIESVTAGLWVPNDRDATDNANRYAHGFIAVPIVVNYGQAASGFRHFGYWQVGEQLEVEVVVTNRGDDAGGFNIEVAAGFEYAGKLVPGKHGAAGSALVQDTDLEPGPLPNSIAAHAALRLVFRAKLTKEGPLSFAASVSRTGPVDPLPTNNRGATTITVRPRTASAAVKFSGGELSGTSAQARRSTDGAAAAPRRSPPVDIAVVRVHRDRCEWLKNVRGELTRGTKSLPCGAPVWLKTTARGTRWTYRLAAVPPRDTYLVLIRPRGANVAEFGYRLGNLIRLRLP